MTIYRFWGVPFEKFVIVGCYSIEVTTPVLHPPITAAMLAAAWLKASSQGIEALIWSLHGYVSSAFNFPFSFKL